MRRLIIINVKGVLQTSFRRNQIRYKVRVEPEAMVQTDRITLRSLPRILRLGSICQAQKHIQFEEKQHAAVKVIKVEPTNATN